MPGHRKPAPPADPATPRPPAGVVRRNTLGLAAANLFTGSAFCAANPGTAPSVMFLQLVAPLPVWGAVLILVGVLLILDLPVSGHAVAVPVWLFWGVGALLGAVGGTTRSPAVSLALTGVVASVAFLHFNAMGWRHRARRAGLIGKAEGPDRADLAGPRP